MYENDEPRNPFDGMSTDGEVEALLEKFGDLKPGDSVRYSEVIELVGADKETVRFWTVTNRWRRLYEQATGVIIGCDKDNQCFYGLTAPDRVRYAAQQAKKGRRRTRRAHDVAVRTNTRELSIEEREVNMKLAHVTAALKMAYNREVRRLATASPFISQKGADNEGLSRKADRRNAAADAPGQSQLRRQLERLAEKSREQGQERAG